MREWFENGATRLAAILAGAFLICVFGFTVIWFVPIGKVTYSIQFETASTTAAVPREVVTHISTPMPVKAVYMTSWAAGSQKFRKELYDLVENTEINSVVIDVKDYTGRISFPVEDAELAKFGSAESRIPDIKDFIRRLHDRNVYVIGRISAFQDSYLINVHPDWAVKTMNGSIWKDYKGVKWLDAGAKPVWDYLVLIGNQAYAYGFDELNFDYIRFPSDGNLKDVSYSWSNGRTRSEVMREFFLYLREQFASTSIPLSADLFGLVTTSEDDLGIGQVLTDALPYFDYVSPMVYPSHFSSGFLGISKPAEHPYEVVKLSMERASAKALAASSTPAKLRPWLQDFNLGAKYTPAMVRAQIQATYDSGLTSWMLWNAGSVYQKESLLTKNQVTSSSSTPPMFGQ